MAETASRFPLQWPTGWRRTPAGERQRARFVKITRTAITLAGGSAARVDERRGQLSIPDALKRLTGELGRLNATSEVLSTNIAVRVDGTLRLDRPSPADPGVAVYFKLEGEERVLACDRWDRVADNIAALAAHVDAIRAIDRYGVGTLKQAFAGYKALAPSYVDWWLVLGIPRTSTLEQVEAKFTELARRAHPDRGGSADEMAKLNGARDQARKELTGA